MTRCRRGFQNVRTTVRCMSGVLAKRLLATSCKRRLLASEQSTTAITSDAASRRRVVQCPPRSPVCRPRARPLPPSSLFHQLYFDHMMSRGDQPDSPGRTNRRTNQMRGVDMHVMARWRGEIVRRP